MFMLDDDDETQIGRTNCPVAPRVGEYIWLQNTADYVKFVKEVTETERKVVDMLGLKKKD